MRAERCDVTVDSRGDPALVVWLGQPFAVQRVLRTFCTGGSGTGGLSTPLREHWWVQSGETTLHVYRVEYGGREVLWWLAAIDPDPRGFMRLM